MKIPIKVLIVEDSEFDARILVNLLRQGGYDVKSRRVEVAPELEQALASESWDVILSDYNLPNFNALDALSLLQKSGRDTPFLIVSGGIGEDTAVAAMKAGAHDYLMKGHLARLVPAVEREMREATERDARRQAEFALRESELRYRLLWETASDAVVLFDEQGTIHFANPAVWDVFGYTPQELVGQPISLLQPEGLRATEPEVILQALRAGVKNLQWRTLETVGRRQGGKEITVEIGFGEMELHGKRWFVGFIRDISQRKKAEQTLRENAEQFRIAREIQQRLFPKAPPALAGFDLWGASFPADATGGDYFDYLPMLGKRIGLVVGDVTGHGIGPALLMAETRAYLRVVARNRDDVGEILTRTNRVLAEDVGYERYITLLLLRLDPVKRILTYANAGHPSGFLLNAQGQVRLEFKPTGVPLGRRPDTQYQTAEGVTLEDGDLLLLLTDGIDETIAADNDFFGVDRALEVVRKHRREPAKAILEALIRAVQGFADGVPQSDDLTAVVMKVGATG